VVDDPLTTSIGHRALIHVPRDVNALRLARLSLKFADTSEEYHRVLATTIAYYDKENTTVPSSPEVKAVIAERLADTNFCGQLVYPHQPYKLVQYTAWFVSL
jgi:hypothetical protein